jgi:hypothetical protein
VPYLVAVDEATKTFPQFKFEKALPPSEQKCAFHVVDADGRHPLFEDDWHLRTNPSALRARSPRCSPYLM